MKEKILDKEMLEKVEIIDVSKLKDFEVLRQNLNKQELYVLKKLFSKKPRGYLNREILNDFEIIGILEKEKGKYKRYNLNADFERKFKGKIKEDENKNI